MKSLWLATAAFASFGGVAWGQAAPQPPKPITILDRKVNSSIFAFDYGPPTSPAMTLLGLTPDKTPPSTSLTKFVVSLPTVFQNSAGQSIAFDAAPAALWNSPAESSFANYKDRGWTERLGYRTRIGAAALNGDASKSIRSRVALGLSASLLDSADPLMTGASRANGLPFLLGCLNTLNDEVAAVLVADASADADFALFQRRNAFEHAIRLINGNPPDYKGARARVRPYLRDQSLPDPDFKALVEREIEAWTKGTGVAAEQAKKSAEADAATDKALAKAGLDRRIANCATAASRMARFSPDLDIGVGLIGRGDPGQIDHVRDGGSVVWAAYKHPFGVKFPQPDAEGLYASGVDATVPEKAWTVAISARYGRGEYVATGDKTTPEVRADTLEAWIGLERLSDALRFAAQYGWVDVNARGPLANTFDKQGERYLVSSQIRLGDSHSGFWVGLAYGNGYGSASSLKGKTAMITLSFAPPAPAAITGK